MIKGWVDRARIDRRNAYLIHCSMVSKKVDMYEYLPLPFDDELKEIDEQALSESINNYYAVASNFN